MRITYRSQTFTESEFGTDVLERLAEIYPEGARQLPRTRGFEFELEDRDPRTQAILALLAERGFDPAAGRGAQPGRTFSLLVTRTYDAADMEGCEYADLAGFEGQFVADWSGARDARGRLTLTGRLKAGADFGITVGTDWFLVSERIKDALEAEGFAHVLLRPTVLAGKAASAKGQGPLWELASDLLAPHLSPSLLRVRSDGTLTDDEETGDFAYREGLTFPEVSYPYQVRYTRASLAAIEPFDLAIFRIQARRWPAGLLPRPRLASARFYHVSRKLGLPFRWHPVRVDE